MNLLRLTLIFSCILAGSAAHVLALPPINLFRPWDKMMIPHYFPGSRFQFTVGYEGAVSVQGFQADDDDNKSIHQRRVDDLQIYQCEQDALAALKNFEPCSDEGQLAQEFNSNDDNLVHGQYVPHAKFKIPVNLMFSARWYVNDNVHVGVHLPYYRMELSDVRFKQKHNNTTFEDLLDPDLLQQVAKLGDICLQGWKRDGVGDLLVQTVWNRDYPQRKPLLTNVRPQIRIGVNIPTGKKVNEDLLLAFPFGTDGAWGLEFGGGLDLVFGRFLKGGFDIDLLYAFGNTRKRRIKTDAYQTDLLFLTRKKAFLEFGLFQEYNLYLEVPLYLSGLSCRVNYQNLKQNDTIIYPCNDRIDPLIANSAESLQEWSTNSLIFNVRYDPFCRHPESWCRPSISAWFKWGFLGKRALLADTLGIQLSMSY